MGRRLRSSRGTREPGATNGRRRTRRRRLERAQRTPVTPPVPLPIYTTQGGFMKPWVMPHNRRPQCRYLTELGGAKWVWLPRIPVGCAYDRPCGGDRRGRSTGMMLAGELALAGVDVAIVERRPGVELAGSRAWVCTRERSRGSISVESLSDFSRRERRRRLPASPGSRWTSATVPPATTTCSRFGRTASRRSWPGWVGELAVPIFRGREVTGSRRRRPESM